MLPNSPKPDAAEFDGYAVGGYRGGMEDPIKQAFGTDLDQFLRTKVRWLLDNTPAGGPTPGRLLDFGCGNGQFLQLLRKQGYRGEMVGADISAGMLQEARARWQQPPSPTWTHFAPGHPLPFDDGRFDVAVACCVFHHIPPAERDFAARELRRLVRPGGRVYVFEHNPYNPVTQLIVCRASIDRDAILLSARRCRRILGDAGFEHARTTYLMFAPPKWRGAARIDRRFCRLPVGGQYVVEAR